MQSCRACWREATVYSDMGLLPYNPHLNRRIYAGEELPRSLVAEDDAKLEDNVSYWSKRRCICMERRDIARAAADYAKLKKSSIVKRKEGQVCDAFSHEFVVFDRRS